jgi:serine/threonine-protein kinase
VKTWALPVLSAAAVLVIGVTIGVVTTHDPGQPARSAGAATRPTASVPSSPRTTARMPSLVGMATAAATRTATRAGFTVQIDHFVSAQMPPGIVVAQEPAAGATVAAGSTITLKVAAS